MFFIRGLSSHGKEVFVNPDQVLYVRPARWFRNGSVLVMAHRECLPVDQDTQTVRRRFEEYLNEIVTADDREDDDASGRSDAGLLSS